MADISIPTGSDGAPGLNGGFGGYSLRYTFDNTAGTSAATGTLRFNNANLAIATILAVSTNVASGINISTVLSSLDTPCLIRIFSEFDETKFFYGKIDSSTVTQGVYNITPIQANGTIDAGESVVISFTPYTAASILQATATITSAQILASNTTQYTVIAAPTDATKAIELLHVSAEIVNTGSVTPYATNLSCVLANGISAFAQVVFPTQFLSSSVARRILLNFQAMNNTSSIQLVAGQPIIFYTTIGNPTAGNSDIKLRMIYTIS